MDHLDVPQFLGLLVVILGFAKLFGAVAKSIGQPSILGELVAGVVLGLSVMGLVDPKHEVLHLLAEIGVIILLFEIGLETDLRKLLKAGGSATMVAVVGVALPFALGYGACRMLGLDNLVAIVAGASLTATSVGITRACAGRIESITRPRESNHPGRGGPGRCRGARDSGGCRRVDRGPRSHGWECRRDDRRGLRLPDRNVVDWLFHCAATSEVDGQDRPAGTPTILAIMLAFGLAWLASVVGSAVIMGAFAAGLLLRGTPHEHEIEHGVAHLGHFFVPLFFVNVGAAVDVRVLNPLNPANHWTLLVGGVLIVVAIASKFAAGFAPFWFKGDKRVIGVGMIPRGEVGLIFAQMGLASGALDASLFSAITLMVMVTTFIAPPLLKYLSPPKPSASAPREPEGLEELVN